MKLRLGVMKNAELAEWFGVTEKYFSKHKTQFLERLREYADATTTYGGMRITRIMLEEYVKKESKPYTNIVEHFDDTWAEDGFDTCKHVADKLYAARIPLKADGTSITSGSCYVYTRAARKELYGTPFGEPGKLGTCEYQWGKDGPDGKPIPLTEEEEAIRCKYLKMFFGTADEKTAEVQELVDKKQLDPADAWDFYSGLMGDLADKYKEFLAAMRAEGINLKKCTLVHRNFPKK